MVIKNFLKNRDGSKYFTGLMNAADGIYLKISDTVHPAC